MSSPPGAARRKRARALGFLVLVLVATAACGAPPQAPAPTTLNVLMTDDWATTPPMLDAVRDFEQSHPGVRVQMEGVSVRETMAVVKARIAAGDSPDVVQGHAFSAGVQDVAEPLDDLWKTHLHPDEFLKGAVEDVTWGEHRYGVPLDTNAMVLLYNKSHFSSTGAAPPTTWRTFADVRQAAAAVTAPDGSRRALAFPFNTWQAYGWIRANGGEVISVAGNGTVQLTLDAPAVVEAVRFLAGLVRDGQAFASLRNDVFTDAPALFAAGNASVLPTGSWVLPQVDATGADRYGWALLPGGARGTTHGSAMGGSSLFVPKGSGQRSLAFDFMLHLTADRYALRFAKEEGRLPARARVFRDPYFERPELRTVLDQLEVASPFRLVALPKASSLFSQAVDDALHGRKDAAAALQDAQRKAEQGLADARGEPAD